MPRRVTELGSGVTEIVTSLIVVVTSTGLFNAKPVKVPIVKLGAFVGPENNCGPSRIAAFALSRKIEKAPPSAKVLNCRLPWSPASSCLA